MPLLCVVCCIFDCILLVVAYTSCCHLPLTDQGISTLKQAIILPVETRPLVVLLGGLSVTTPEMSRAGIMNVPGTGRTITETVEHRDVRKAETELAMSLKLGTRGMWRCVITMLSLNTSHVGL